MLDFARFRWLTFDCYGTLIDWESGILGALRPVLRAHGADLDDARILELYAQLEAEAEDGDYRPYRRILEEVAYDLPGRFGIRISEPEARSLPDSVRDWQPFPDTVGALRALKQRYKLAVISNIDDDLFAKTARRLEVLGAPFDVVITAQQARSYKPSLNNFRLALESMAAQPGEVLHVAQSLYHDVLPAKSLGLATVWVNRKSARPGGATPAVEATPDLEVSTLAELVELIEGKARAQGQ